MGVTTKASHLIDTHCHLEQHIYDVDRDVLLAQCRRNLSAVITNAPDPSQYDLTFDMAYKNRGFLFAVAGIHPEYIGTFSDDNISGAINKLKKNRHRLVGIGETGLDYAYIHDESQRKQQWQLFLRFINLGKELSLPIVVHLRNGRDEADVFDDAFNILRVSDARRVHLHMFGCRRLVEEAVGLGYFISMNAIVLHSKTYQKVVRDTPLERLMLETDAPWLHPTLDRNKRNDPTHVREVAEKIAEIKEIPVDQVIESTTRNAVEFYDLKLHGEESGV